MPHAIIVGTLVQSGDSSWYEGLPCNAEQLVTELEALAVAGIRTYSVFGRPNEVAGVYPWSDLAPLGEYRHVDEPGFAVTISAADEQRIRDTILAHIPG